MQKENKTSIINIIDYKDIKNNNENALNLKAHKLLLFDEYFRQLGLDINFIDFRVYDLNVTYYNSVMGFMGSRNNVEDLETNAIYVLWNKIKRNAISFCDDDLNVNLCYKADIIILNLARQLFRKHFKDSEVKFKNINNIVQTINWAYESSYIKSLSLFYYVYISNTTHIFLEMINSYALASVVLEVNLKLLSYTFIKQFKENEYFDFMDKVFKNPYFLEINLEAYDYFYPIYNINSAFFENKLAFAILNRKELVNIFGLNSLAIMSSEELEFIYDFNDIEVLEEIKQMYDLGIPINKIKRKVNTKNILKRVLNL